MTYVPSKAHIRFSIFRVNDDDGTKTLNRRELHRLVVQYGVKANADEVAELFEQLDTDGTGSISFDEFIAALRVIHPWIGFELNTTGIAAI